MMAKDVRHKLNTLLLSVAFQGRLLDALHVAPALNVNFAHTLNQDKDEF